MMDNFTKEELEEIVWCMEQMQSAYWSDEPGLKNWETALNKLDDILNQRTS